MCHNVQQIKRNMFKSNFSVYSLLYYIIIAIFNIVVGGSINNNTQAHSKLVEKALDIFDVCTNVTLSHP